MECLNGEQIASSELGVASLQRLTWFKKRPWLGSARFFHCRVICSTLMEHYLQSSDGKGRCRNRVGSMFRVKEKIDFVENAACIMTNW